MTVSKVFPIKDTNEVLTLTFNFIGQMNFGEAINDAVVTSIVHSGTDPNPENIVLGASTIDGTVVSQVITNGLPGVIYQVVAAITGTEGNVYTQSGLLSVVSYGSMF